MALPSQSATGTSAAAQGGTAGRPPLHRIAALLGGFVVASLVAGMLVAGLALPAVGVAGSFTKDGLTAFNNMKVENEDIPLPEGSKLYARDGKTLIATFYEENRVVTPLSRIAPVMRQAIVAIEDSRFYEHGGVDLKGLLRALISNELNDGQIQGASTLTQQYIKNLLVESAVGSGDTAAAKAAIARKNSRKIKEIKMAIEMEKTKPKDQILEGYLNIAPFGQNNYGVEAAAQYFFQTTAAKLTLAQAAMLAGIVQIPESYNPFKHPKAAKARRAVVLNRMFELGMITKAQRDAADAAALPTTPQVAKSGCMTSGDYAYFCDYVKKMLLTDPRYSVLGKNETDRLNSLQRGGYKITTTMDATLMKSATASLKKRIPANDPSGVIASAVTVEPGTGQVLAIAQNTTYSPDKGKGQTEVSYGVDRAYGGSSGFQVGSTFKAFTLAEWLNKGKGLGTMVSGNTRDWNGRDFTACGSSLGGGNYEFDNSEGSGPDSISVLEATYNSVNRAYIDMESRLDMCEIAKRAEALGVHLAAPDDGACQADGQSSTKIPTQCPSLTLGAVELSPMTMANAYAGFAADGTYCPPTPVISIMDRSNKSLSVGTTACVSDAIPSAVARGVTYALKRVLTQGTAQGNGLGTWPAAGKTGTTDASVRTWFVGYTVQRSTAVLVTDPQIYSHSVYDSRVSGPHSLNNRTIGGRNLGHIFGATIAAPLWRSIMKVAMTGLQPKDWSGPNAKMLEGTGVRVTDVTGMTLADATSALQGQGFKVKIGNTVASSVTPDRVAKTSPAAGGRLEKGSTVVIYPGDGSQPADGGDNGGDGNNNGGNNNGGGNNGNNTGFPTTRNGVR